MQEQKHHQLKCALGSSIAEIRMEQHPFFLWLTMRSIIAGEGQGELLRMATSLLPALQKRIEAQSREEGVDFFLFNFLVSPGEMQMVTA